jgi:hypothetical protein
MGYTNGTGPDGTPSFNNTPQLTSDLNRLRDLTLERGNARVGTTADQASLPPARGLFLNLNDGFLYGGFLGDWYPIAGLSSQGALGHSPGVTGNVPLEFLRKDHLGMVEFYWSGTYVNNLANGSLIGNVPAGFRPPATVDLPAAGTQGAGGPCIVTVQANGNITVYVEAEIVVRKISFYAKYPVGS